MSIVPFHPRDKPSRIPYDRMTPYDDWWRIPDLEQEKVRILSLNPLDMQTGRHVMRWRSKQVWMITKRIEWLNKIRNTGEKNV